ncbi:MAG: hypothetical protein ACI82F_003621 [Planctomycetota bacterium]|jgi:hypothetical protein
MNAPHAQKSLSDTPMALSLLWAGVVRTLLLLLSLSMLGSLARAGEPKLERVLPRGGQRGTEVVVTLTGEHLRETVDLLFTGTGIELVTIEECAKNSARLRLRIAPDCRLGLHALRVRTRTGLSNLRTFSVGALPEVEEVLNNDSLDSAQFVPLDCTLVGVAQNEDVDYYAFDVKAGERVSAEIEGLRLGDTLFDASLAILDAGGFELATCDDLALLRQDACVSLSVPADGRYYLRVRESSYRGNENCHYRLHLGRFPRPLALFPAGGAPGEILQARIIGQQPTSAELPGAEFTIALPQDIETLGCDFGWTVPGVYPVFVNDELGSAPSPNWVRVTDLQSTLEVEPNGSRKEATPWALPGAVDGIISTPGDRDFYRFKAQKDEQFHVMVFARKLRSPLDAVIAIRDVKGKVVLSNDDSDGPDSYVRFKAPADGVYTVDIRDQLWGGGPNFVYRIEAHRIEPYLRFEAPRTRQALAVPRGGRAVLMLSTIRLDCDGAFEVQLPDLPPGVTAEIPRVPAGMDSFPVVLVATPEAELAQALTRVTPTLVDADGQATIAVEGNYRQDVELVTGRNRTLFWAHSVDRLAVAVVAPAPFSLEVVENAAPLVQNGSATLHVKLTRDEGFNGKVKLRVPFLPSGVNARQEMTLESEQTEIHIPINARGDATIGEWFLVVEAEAYQGQGVLRVASAPISLEVRSPFVRFTAQATSVEAGEVAGLHIKVERLEGFEGTAQVEIGGLPHHVSAAALPLGATSESLDFTIATQNDSPIGRHKQLFCIARFETEAGLVVHRLSAADLLINAPPQVVVAAIPELSVDVSTKPEEPEAVRPEPLSRLAILRLEHKRHLAEQRAARTAIDALAVEGGEYKGSTVGSVPAESPVTGAQESEEVRLEEPTTDESSGETGSEVKDTQDSTQMEESS